MCPNRRLLFLDKFSVIGIHFKCDCCKDFFSLNSRGGCSSSCGGCGCCPEKSIEILIAIEIYSKHDF